MDTKSQLEISRYLESGEPILWSGVPKQGLLLRAADAFLIPFSLFWGGFAIFWEVGALRSNGPPFFALFGVPFVLMGLYFIFGRFFLDSKLRANTFYGLTNRRIVIVSGILSRTTTSLPLRTLHDVSVRERRDRTGTIMFGRPDAFGGWYAGMQWPGMGQYQTPSFELIPDVMRVHDQVLAAQRAAA